MSDTPELTGELRSAMERKSIDISLSLEILSRFNRGEFDHFEPVRATEIPEADGSTVIDFTGSPELALEPDRVRDRLSGLIPDEALARLGRDIGAAEGNKIRFGTGDLETIGLLLLPRVSYGVLNGGSATSYADRKKNRSFSEPLFELLQEPFNSLADTSHGRPKGLTPAFVQPDGTFGPSFLELKMRGLLAMAARSRQKLRELAPGSGEGGPTPLLPLFEMTSVHTDDDLRAAYPGYRAGVMLADLIERTGLDPTRTRAAVQPLISAFTHSKEGRPKNVFARAYGKENEPLPLPGGHGQNFAVLSDLYRSLHDEGKRFVYLGNVDNLGFLPDPVEVAFLALRGSQAAFDFAYKTPVDVKGGILVRDQHGGLNCADIGPAISPDEVATAEAGGKPILFNTACGLFDLNYLVPNLERIARDLPTRFTDQSKDAGDYSQAEQVTWEVIGMLDDVLVFSVSKWDRFLAAKLLTETLMSSGLKLDSPAYPSSDDPTSDLRGTARKLHAGLVRKLENEYAMELRAGRWEPIPAESLVDQGADQ